MSNNLTPDEAAALAELEWELTSPHSVVEIAEYLGINHQLVSQIEQRALRKMQKLLAKRKITSADL